MPIALLTKPTVFLVDQMILYTMTEKDNFQKRNRQINFYFAFALMLLFVFATGFLVTAGINRVNDEPVNYHVFFKNSWFLLFLIVTLLYILSIILVNYTRIASKDSAKPGSSAVLRNKK